MTKPEDAALPAVGSPVVERVVGRLEPEQAGPWITLVQPKLPRVKFFAGKPGDRYMPSNGTEGEFFHGMWCEECERDGLMSGRATQEQCDADPSLYCQTLGESFTEKTIPEWVYGEDGQPCCTRFWPRGTPIPFRCPRTPDLFEPPNVRANRAEPAEKE